MEQMKRIEGTYVFPKWKRNGSGWEADFTSPRGEGRHAWHVHRHSSEKDRADTVDDTSSDGSSDDEMSGVNDDTDTSNDDTSNTDTSDSDDDDDDDDEDDADDVFDLIDDPNATLVFMWTVRIIVIWIIWVELHTSKQITYVEPVWFG
jgi:hypothetical protein